VAGRNFSIVSGETTTTAATPLTLLDITAAVNTQILIREISVSGKASASGTDIPCRIRLSRATGSDTAIGTSTTVYPINPLDTMTFLTTALKTITTEPTSPTVVYEYEIQPQAGQYQYILPLSSPFVVNGGAASTLGHFYIQILSASAETVTVTVRGEE
jgi:hypothetical protein